VNGSLQRDGSVPARGCRPPARTPAELTQTRRC
jgi:hypothetical protein